MPPFVREMRQVGDFFVFFIGFLAIFGNILYTIIRYAFVKAVPAQNAGRLDTYGLLVERGERDGSGKSSGQ